MGLYAYSANDPINLGDPTGLCRGGRSDGDCTVRNEASGDPVADAATQRLQEAVNRVDRAIMALPPNARVVIRDREGRVVTEMTGRQLQRAWNRQTFTVTTRNYGGVNSGGGTAGNGRVEVAASTVMGYLQAGGESGANYLVLHETGHNSPAGRRFQNQQTDSLWRRGGRGFYATDPSQPPNVNLAHPEARANERFANTFAEEVGGAIGLPVYRQQYGTLP